ncbi:MAG: CBS and ACT domain-containing protein [Magnetococcus sp. WYHC-3]
MRIEDIMSRTPISAAPEASLAELEHLMARHHVHHVPIVQDGRLLGMVAHQDLLAARPSPVTTLTRGEVNYLLERVTARQIMKPHPVVCSPDTLVEEAGLLLRRHGIGSLPVLESQRLVGMVTTEDILDFFLDITGCSGDQGSRVALKLSDRRGSLTQLLAVFNELGAYVATLISPTRQDEAGRRVMVIRFRAEQPATVVAGLRERGYDILHEVD